MLSVGIRYLNILYRSLSSAQNKFLQQMITRWELFKPRYIYIYIYVFLYVPKQPPYCDVRLYKAVWPGALLVIPRSSDWMKLKILSCDWFAVVKGAMKNYNNYGGWVYSKKNEEWLATLRVKRLYIAWRRNMAAVTEHADSAGPENVNMTYIKKLLHNYALCTTVLPCSPFLILQVSCFCSIYAKGMCSEVERGTTVSFKYYINHGYNT